MRIAMVGLRAPWGTEGGVEQAVAELAPRLSQRGCQVSVYCRSRYNPLGQGQHQGVNLINVPTLYGRSTEAFLHTALCTPLAALRHDLVHYHAAGPGIFSPLPRLFGRVSVVTLHGKDWERDKWGPAARSLLRLGAWTGGHLAHQQIAVSQTLTDWCQRFPVPVQHIPNGVAPHQETPWDSAAFPGLSPKEFYLYLGRLVPEKELEVLLYAMRASSKKLVVAGGSGYTDDYVQKIRSIAPSNVIFVGSRFQKEKAMLLSHARAFLFPSRIEGFSIALLEAMAAGLPVLASDIAPNQEAMGEVGWYLPAGQQHAWNQRMQWLDQQEESVLHQHGQKLQQRALTLFGWDPVADQTFQLYQRLLGKA